MSNRQRKPRPAQRHTQAGYVTVMIAMLFGVAFTATVLGAAAYIRSTQAQAMAAHAQTQAQLKAWTGAEIVREYLAAEQTNGSLPALAALVANSQTTALAFSGVSGVSAALTGVNSSTDPTVFTANIVGTTAAGTPAQATSTLQVVYTVNAGTGSAAVAALNFNRNLVLGGSITVNQPSGSNISYTINVMGDVTTGGNSITGVSVINSTGSINIGSGSSFQQLNSDCDVSISGSVTAVAVSAQRNVCSTGGAAVSGTTLANGSVSSQSAGNGTINAIANPTGVSSCTASGASQNGTVAATCPLPYLYPQSNYAAVDLRSGSAGAAVVNTDGNVWLGSGNIGRLNAVGSLNFTNWGTVGVGVIGGAKNLVSQYQTGVNVTQIPNNTVSITAASPVSITSSQFNAYSLQTAANYAFTINSANNVPINGFLAGYALVTVANIYGITNGTYYLGSYPSTNNNTLDYLCTAITQTTSTNNPFSATCQTPAAASAFRICEGFSPQNSCFSYSSGTWTINGTTMAPGIAWFQGNLALGSGTYYNSFIATGNITTSGSDNVYALNFAGYSGGGSGATAYTGICSNIYFSAPYSYFKTIYPMQFCNTTTQTYNPSASSGIGNYAFMAGSWVGASYPGQAGYVGGNVTTGASSKVYGNIEAGNEFQSSGSTTISGSVTALAQGAAVQNSMGASTTFNLTNLPSTFSMTSSAPGVTGGTGGTGVAAAGTINIEWARYL
jgi:hypothetical protein